jgi:hypothetical protein
MSRLFADVRKLLQMSIFILESCRVCSPLFIWVGVKLVSRRVSTRPCHGTATLVLVTLARVILSDLSSP